MDPSKARSVAFLASFAGGLAIGGLAGSVRQPRTPAELSAPIGVPVGPAPTVAVGEPGSLFDYNAPEATLVLNAVLTHWFTSPGRREATLSHLVDPGAGPFDGSRPALKHVVVESRTVPGWYRPEIPGVAVVVANRSERPPLEPGELGIWVERIAVMADGSVTVEFSQSNHGYAGKGAIYSATRGGAGWRAEIISEF